MSQKHGGHALEETGVAKGSGAVHLVRCKFLVKVLAFWYRMVSTCRVEFVRILRILNAVMQLNTQGGSGSPHELAFFICLSVRILLELFISRRCKNRIKHMGR